MENKRIHIKEEEGKVEINIKALYDEGKQKILTVWLGAWTLCGLFIISQIFTEVNGELKTMILVFGGFWLYFELKVLRAFRWRRAGEERFVIEEEIVHYGRVINNRGFLKPYRKELIGGMQRITTEPTNFIRSMNDSYWVISGETLAFKYGGSIIPFGLRLENKERDRLMKRLQKLFEEKD